MSEGPWIRFFSSDWLAGTRGMTATETGVYITLIAMMYERGGPIKNEPARLSRLCGASNSSFKRALRILIDEGKITEDCGILSNGRVVEELSYRREKSDVARASAESRWHKKPNKNNARNDANAMRTQCDGNANQKPEPEEVVDIASTTAVRGKRGSRIALDWTARDAERQWAREEGWREDDIDDAATRFHDYWLTRTRDATKLDWDRTFLNRLKDLNDRRKQGPPRQRNGMDRTMNVIRAMYEEANELENNEALSAGKLVQLIPPTRARGN